MSKWQPIETAPKDCEFLVHNTDHNEQFVCYWDYERSKFVYGSGLVDYIDLSSGKSSWMPLPYPPK